MPNHVNSNWSRDQELQLLCCTHSMRYVHTVLPSSVVNGGTNCCDSRTFFPLTCKLGSKSRIGLLTETSILRLALAGHSLDPPARR